jgi:hypothetical protein
VTDVAFADIVPAFAYHDAKLHFVPEGVAVVRDLPQIPAAAMKPSGKVPRPKPSGAAESPGGSPKVKPRRPLPAKPVPHAESARS